MFDISKMKWVREPRNYSINQECIEIVTAPHTDLWQRTYYHFRNDNAPVLQMETEEKFFSFVAKTDFSESHHRFDQCGVALYLDSENWLKASVEYENEKFQLHGSIYGYAGGGMRMESARRSTTGCVNVIRKCPLEGEWTRALIPPLPAASRTVLDTPRHLPAA